jgi:hypothetical protein
MSSSWRIFSTDVRAAGREELVALTDANSQGVVCSSGTRLWESTDPDHHQQAEFVIHSRQIALTKRTLLGFPLLGQLRDHRRGQAAHLGDVRGLARPRRQGRRGEPPAFAGVSASTRLSFTRGAVTSPEPPEVSTTRGS